MTPDDLYASEEAHLSLTLTLFVFLLPFLFLFHLLLKHLFDIYYVK